MINDFIYFYRLRPIIISPLDVAIKGNRFATLARLLISENCVITIHPQRRRLKFKKESQPAGISVSELEHHFAAAKI